jgi:murein DD-endopeptidase MepM/ murein hydrolase activator NlpD
MLVIIMAFRATDVVEQVPLAATISADNHFPDLKPVAADITSGFGMRMHPEIKEKRMHKGVDFQVASGTAVKAAGSGTVSDIQHHPHTYGELLIIDHGNGYLSRYAHLSEIKYKIGETVQQGEVVALSGNTGMSSVPHLHFEILYQGNFIDPETLLK